MSDEPEKPAIPKPSIPKPNLEPRVQSPPVPKTETPPAAPAFVDSDPGPKSEPSASVTSTGGVELSTRLIAGLIDGMVAVMLNAGIVFLFPNALDRLGWIVAAAYWITRDSLLFLKNQSLGKTAMKIKVVKESGGSLEADWRTAFIRNILMAIPFGPLVELAVLLFRQDKPEAGKRLGDEWAKTKVVSAR